ncbi:MAG: Mrp/NBP35 family ATP-binding protein [Chloroflexi bacterium]|nr:Mrp/NBP35 family ATP-binding protein [Chloroflexota bacterium]
MTEQPRKQSASVPPGEGQPPTEQRPERPVSPLQRQRLEAIKQDWQRRRQIGERLGRIKTKIGVYSGKGGVGKTTVAVNLAVTLAQQGHRVGLLDADIDCPNVIMALGVTQPPGHEDGEFLPSTGHGVKVMSMAFFQQNPEEAIIWRGPMIHNAINQFLQATNWGDLDFLLVDLPPGTSDAPLTVMQALQMDGFVVVTTPQALAKLDAKRSINMIKKMNVNVLGVVENLSGEMFGSGAGEELARETGLSFLGRLEMRKEYRQDSRPAVLASPKVRREYELIVHGLLERLEALRGKADSPAPAPEPS